MGRYLGDILFPPEIADEYRVRRRLALAAGQRLRLMLNIREQELAALPWEMLRLPRDPDFLAHDPELALVRTVTARRQPLLPTPGDRLRVLAILASPVDQDPLNLQGELQVLIAALGGADSIELRVLMDQVLADSALTALKARDPAAAQRVHIVGPPTEKALLKALQQGCDVLHFAGHGSASADGVGVLVLEGKERQSDFYEADRLAAAVGRAGLSLAVLAACNTARRMGDPAQLVQASPLPVAEALAREGVPAVIAMQTPVKDRRATLFSRELYQALSRWLPIEECVTQTRLRMFQSLGGEVGDWAAPVLFMADVRDQPTLEQGEPAASAVVVLPPVAQPPARRRAAPAVSPHLHHFVTRRDDPRSQVHSRLQNLLAVPQIPQAPVIEVVGEQGIGKTMLLTWLFYELDRAGTVYPLYVTVHDVANELQNLSSGSDAADAARLSYTAYAKLLDDLAEDLVGAALEPPQAGEGHGPVEQAVVLARQFARRREPGRRIAIFVDDQHLVAPYPLGDWLYDLARYLSDAVLIIGRRPVARTQPLPPDRVHGFTLGPFDRDQVQAYLAASRAPHPVDERLVERVYRYSGGNPLVMGLAGEIVERLEDDTERLLEFFDDVNDPAGDQLQKMLTVLLGSLEQGPAESRRVISACAVARRFDEPLLAHLLDMDATQARRLLTDLSGQPFVQVVKDQPEAANATYRFHEFVRRELERRLQRADEQTYIQLHKRAEQYYRRLIAQYEDDGNFTALNKLYRLGMALEDPRWQHIHTEWLYHLARLPQRQEARLAFARIYFFAFWWWGCYIPFDFCTGLLEDWNDTQPGDEDRAWVRQLMEFQRCYPTGYRKRGQGDWDAVAGILGSLRTNLNLLRPGVRRLSADGRVVRAYTNIFLADAYAFGQEDWTEAETLLQEAYAIFSGRPPPASGEAVKPDLWNMAWLQFELADLYLDAGDLDRAWQANEEAAVLAARLDTLEEAAEEADGDSAEEEPGEGNDERELKANIARLRGDIYQLRGDLAGAFTAYNQAVFHAYASQGIPTPPDLYTQAFYREMRTRFTEWLADLWRADRRAEAEQFCLTARAFWGPPRQAPRENPGQLLEESRLADLQAWLFPPEPQPRDFESEDYQSRVLRFVERKERTD
jgi:hypothetical protein